LQYNGKVATLQSDRRGTITVVTLSFDEDDEMTEHFDDFAPSKNDADVAEIGKKIVALLLNRKNPSALARRNGATHSAQTWASSERKPAIDFGELGTDRQALAKWLSENPGKTAAFRAAGQVYHSSSHGGQVFTVPASRKNGISDLSRDLMNAQERKNYAWDAIKQLELAGKPVPQSMRDAYEAARAEWLAADRRYEAGSAYTPRKNGRGRMADLWDREERRLEKIYAADPATQAEDRLWKQRHAAEIQAIDKYRADRAASGKDPKGFITWTKPHWEGGVLYMPDDPDELKAARAIKIKDLTSEFNQARASMDRARKAIEALEADGSPVPESFRDIHQAEAAKFREINDRLLAEQWRATAESGQVRRNGRGPSIVRDVTTIYPSRQAAESAAAALRSGDSDGWTYRVIARSDGQFIIAIHDQDGERVANWGL
jgi:hypothetical protein